MNKFIFFFIFFLMNNCSFNQNSNFWTEQNEEKIKKEKIIKNIIDKSNNIMTLSIDEFEIYLDNYVENNDYPILSNEKKN